MAVGRRGAGNHGVLCAGWPGSVVGPALPAQPYSDPALRSAKEYGKFLRHLAARNLIDFVLPGQRLSTVGPFFVKKKGGKMRLVIDCRRSNACFGRPDSVSLCSGDNLPRALGLTRGRSRCASFVPSGPWPPAGRDAPPALGPQMLSLQ